MAREHMTELMRRQLGRFRWLSAGLPRRRPDRLRSARLEEKSVLAHGSFARDGDGLGSGGTVRVRFSVLPTAHEHDREFEIDLVETQPLALTAGEARSQKMKRSRGP